MAGGEYCAIWLGPEMPGDQREDDAKSACFDTVLKAPLDIVGAPVIRLQLFADRPTAMVAVRLCDVHPDGGSTRITYGVFNLTHRTGHETPTPVKPGETMDIEFRLDDIAYQVPEGHTLRVAISSTYWPLVWPSPEPVTLTLLTGSIDIPERAGGSGDEAQFQEPEAARPWNTQTVRPATNSRDITRDEKTGVVTLSITMISARSATPITACIMAAWRANAGPSIRPIRCRRAASRTGPRPCRGTSGRCAPRPLRPCIRTRRTSTDGPHRGYEGEERVFERDFHETIERDCI